MGSGGTGGQDACRFRSTNLSEDSTNNGGDSSDKVCGETTRDERGTGRGGLDEKSDKTESPIAPPMTRSVG